MNNFRKEVIEKIKQQCRRITRQNKIVKSSSNQLKSQKGGIMEKITTAVRNYSSRFKI